MFYSLVAVLNDLLLEFFWVLYDCALFYPITCFNVYQSDLTCYCTFWKVHVMLFLSTGCGVMPRAGVLTRPTKAG